MEFVDCSTPYPSLYMINKDESDKTKETTLAVHPPAIGSLASKYTLSRVKHSSNHSMEVTMDGSLLHSTAFKSQKVLLLNSHASNKALSSKFLSPSRVTASWGTSWRTYASCFGEFSFISGHWEWLEDVYSRRNKNLHDAGIYDAVWASMFTYDIDEDIFRTSCDLWSSTTNSLHTPIGEISISLLDVHSLGGLSVRGSFYDEVIPSAKELLNVAGEACLPSSCRHLFAAYHHNKGINSGPVLVFDWVSFWFKGTIKYQEPLWRSSTRESSKSHPSFCRPNIFFLY